MFLINPLTTRPAYTAINEPEPVPPGVEMEALPVEDGARAALPLPLPLPRPRPRPRWEQRKSCITGWVYDDIPTRCDYAKEVVYVALGIPLGSAAIILGISVALSILFIVVIVVGTTIDTVVSFILSLFFSEQTLNSFFAACNTTQYTGNDCFTTTSVYCNHYR